jgi:hypothetical protein
MSAWRRWLFLGLLLLIFPLAGCSVLIANTYMATASHDGYEWDEFVVPQTQQEVHAALGKPTETFGCSDGGRLDLYRLPRKGDVCLAWAVVHSTKAPDRDFCSVGWRVYRGVLVGLADVLSLGFWEFVATPRMLSRIHEKEKDRGEWHVAFVYDPEDRILYRYDAAPGDQEGLVLGPLTQQLTFASDPPRCSSWRDCVGRGVAEMRRAATCLDYTLTPAAAQRVEWVERIAEEVDGRRLTLEAGLDALYWCYRRPEGPCPFADNKGAPPTK